MSTITIGLDITKSVFHLVWMNNTGKVLKRKQLSRKKVAEYFANIEACTVVMEACTAHITGHECYVVVGKAVKRAQ